MTESFYYSTSYVLDRKHFSETYDQSKTGKSDKNQYIKALAIALIGLAVLYLTDMSPYIAWFIVVFGGVEALSVRFQKPWWLARQMISKAANEELTLTIDDNGISSKSRHVNSSILWQDITKIEKTSLGWLLYLTTGRSYLSNNCLSDEAQQFVDQKCITLQSQD